ncbi:MAG TPA: TonB-dependent receptor [Burkholderiaceae bacterium]|nr:TonB-dependent receptor [Burkholderiaceae bacterium]
MYRIDSRITLIASAIAQLAFAGAAQAQAAAAAAAPASSASAAAPAATASGAATGLQQIIVTAERHVQDMQKTALSVVAIPAEELSEQGLSTSSEALKSIANVEVQGAAKGTTISIRGLGSDLPPGIGENAVSTNYDGVYNVRNEQGTVGYFDLARLEVLRGPQGTLYGRNATGGVVNVISNDPVLGKAGGHFSLEAGNYNLLRGEAAVNVPISDTLALRAAVAAINRDGFLSNGHDDLNGQAARLKLLFKPSAGNSVLFGVEKVKEGGKGPGASDAANWPSDPLKTSDPSEGSQTYHSTKTWLQADFDLGFATLTAIPSYSHGSGETVGYFGGNGSDSQDPKDITQKSAEVRLAGNGKGPLQWSVGAYYYDMFQWTSGVGLTSPYSTSFTKDWATSKALFGQVTYALTDSLRLVGGVRETHDWKRGVNGGFFNNDASKSWSHADYRGSLEYDLAKDVMLYGTIATGYRPGGFNNQDGSPYKPETLTSYEAGVKSRLFDNQVEINADVFDYMYKNYQTVDFYIDTASNAPIFSYYNVPHQRIRGVELEAQALLTMHDKVNASIAYLDGKFGSGFAPHVNGPFSPGVDLSGEPLPHSPKGTAKLGYQHFFDLPNDGRITARLDGRYTSAQYVSLSESEVSLQKGYTTGDASLVYSAPDDKWSLTAYCKNVNNKITKTAYFVGYLTPSDPRTFGLILNSSF